MSVYPGGGLHVCVCQEVIISGGFLNIKKQKALTLLTMS